jgi:Lhr-like helicase
MRETFASTTSPTTRHVFVSLHAHGPNNYTNRTPTQSTYVLVDKVKATVPRDEGSNLLSVLDQLNTNALADGRVRLLGLNATIGRRDQRR